MKLHTHGKSSIALRGMLLAVLAHALLASAAPAVPQRSMVLASVTDSSPAMQSDGQQLLRERPGYRAELIMQAAQLCDTRVSFELMPWNRALNLVERGGADGAFAASYTAERAAYAAYPMRNGKHKN